MKNTAKCSFFLLPFCLFVLISLGENCSCGAIPSCSVLGEDRGAKRLTDIPTDKFFFHFSPALKFQFPAEMLKGSNLF